MAPGFLRGSFCVPRPAPSDMLSAKITREHASCCGAGGDRAGACWTTPARWHERSTVVEWINNPNPWITTSVGAILGLVLGRIRLSWKMCKPDTTTGNPLNSRLCYTKLIRWYLELALFMALSFLSIALFFDGVLDATAIGQAWRLVGIIVLEIILWRSYVAWGIRLRDCIQVEEQQ